MQVAVDTCPERMEAVVALEAVGALETAGLTMRFFWRTRKKKKNKQKQEAAGEC